MTPAAVKTQCEGCVLYKELNKKEQCKWGKFKRKVEKLAFTIPELGRKLGRVLNFNQSINWHHHMKDYVQSCHLTEFDTFKINRDQVINL